MAESITLQTSDNNVQQSDVLGRLSFAASNESNTSDARLIGATIHAEAEGDFTEISNPTSIVFSTASSESATNKLKITSSGHFVPISNKTYDIGSTSLKFRNIYSETNYPDKIVLTSGSQPSPTENTLYNLSGILHYDTKAIALLPSGGLQNQILQKVSDISYDLQWINNFATEVDVYVKNTTGSGLLKGQAVYINGAQGDHPTITLAQATSDAMSSKTLGLLKQDLANNEFGYVVSEGILTSVNTDSAGSAGDSIWLSPSTPGGLVYGLANKPSAPDHMVFIGYVVVKQQNQGVIYVKPQNGFELEELHDVRIKSLSNNDILTYNSSSGVWANTTNPSGSLNNSIVTVSGMFVSGSGALNDRISTHTHTSSQITDFNSSVSGLLPVKQLTAGTNVDITSTTGNYTISVTGITGGSSNNILEYISPSGFPATGIASGIYIATDSSKIYRWTGSQYVELGPVGGGDTTLWNLFLPAAPTNVTGTAGNAQSVVSWTAPTGVATQTPVTDYIIQHSGANSSSWTTFNDGTSSSTSGTVTGLSNGTAYSFRTAAINIIGTGNFSSASPSVTIGTDAFFSSVEVLLHMEGTGATFTDSSSSPKTITSGGSVTQSTGDKKFGSKSAYFSTTSDSLSFADISLGTGDFAIECFFKTSSSNQYAQIFGNEGAGGSSGFSLLVNHDSGTGGQVALYRAGGFVLSSSAGTDWSDGAWHHIAIARSGSTIRLYIDGTSVASATDSNSYSGSTWYLGLNNQFSGRSLSSAYIDEFRLTKGSARGYTGSTITVPTSAFPDS